MDEKLHFATAKTDGPEIIAKFNVPRAPHLALAYSTVRTATVCALRDLLVQTARSLAYHVSMGRVDRQARACVTQGIRVRSANLPARRGPPYLSPAWYPRAALTIA